MIPKRLWLVQVAIFCVAGLISDGLYAQQAPDAGRLLREQPKPPAQTAPRLKPPAPPQPAAPAADNGPRILVQGFRVEGATLFPADQLAALLKQAVGTERSFSQLRALGLVLVGYYADQGYLARVVLPEQNIKQGIVTYRVIEGRRGSVRVDTKGKRLDSARIERYIARRLAPGAPMDLHTLGEALNVLNEQPGIVARSSLSPGTGEGDIDLVVEAVEQTLTSYNLQANNQGSRATGEWQVGGVATLNNPSGAFDAASALLNASDGTTFGRLDYNIALGDAGLRLGVNASQLDYRLTQSNFSALHGRGTASNGGATLSYPLLRRNDQNLSLNGSYDAKRLRDETVAGETGNRRVEVASVGLEGNRQDGLWGGGVNAFGANVYLGEVKQHNAAALAADQLTRRVEGSYNKLAWYYSRLQIITNGVNLKTSLRGQFADKNLDSSERFSLGGPTGVRAYPVGEALGDEGWLLSFSLAKSLGEGKSASVFVDTGEVTLNRNLWTGWNAASPQIPNRYRLTGAGLALAWQLGAHTSLSASVAAPLGNNPGKAPNGNNYDGSRHRGRAWVSLSTQF